MIILKVCFFTPLHNDKSLSCVRVKYYPWLHLYFLIVILCTNNHYWTYSIRLSTSDRSVGSRSLIKTQTKGPVLVLARSIYNFYFHRVDISYVILVFELSNFRAILIIITISGYYVNYDNSSLYDYYCRLNHWWLVW